MRKIFTTLAVTAISACAIGAYAEEITLSPAVYEGGSYVDYAAQTTELTKNEDGSYTIADFLGSGKPVTFTFEEPAWGGTSLLTIVNADEKDYLVYDNEKFTVSVTSESGETKQFADVWYYNDEYSYVGKVVYKDALANDYKYDARIFLSTDNDDYIPVDFQFGDPEMPAAVESYDITLVPAVSLNNKRVTCDNTFETKLLKLEDGYYCIEDLLGSGKPMVMTIADEPNSDGLYAIRDVNYKYKEGSTNKYLYADGYFTLNLEYNGENHVFTDPRFYQNVKYSYTEDTPFADYDKGAEIRFYGIADGAAEETRFYVNFAYGNYEPVEKLAEEEVTIYSEVYTTDYEDYAKPVESSFSKYNKNIYEVSDFLGSGQPLTFTFEEPAAGESATMTVKQKYVYDAKYDPYLYDSSYYTLKFDAYTSETETTPVEIEYTQYDPEYTYVYKYTDSEAEQYGYQYCAYVSVYGYIGDNYSDYLLLSFNFGKMPEVVETTPITMSASVTINKKAVACDTTYEGELSKLDDGSYAIYDFLGSGKTAKFTVASSASSNGNYIVEFTGCDNQAQEGTTTPLRYLSYDGEHFTVSLDYNGGKHEFTDVRYSRGSSSTYSTPTYFDEYDNAATFRFYGKTDGEELRFDIKFGYGAYDAIEEVAAAEDIYIYSDIYTTDYEEYAKPVESKIQKYTKNIYEISDFLGSNHPLTFRFEEPAAGESAFMTLKQSYKAYSNYDPYLCDINDNYYYYVLKFDAYTSATETTPVEIEYVEYDPDYAYVYRYTDEEAAQYGYEYGGYMTVYGYVGDDYSDTVYLSFNFGKIDNGAGDNVSAVDSNDAPVEYYTLDGIRTDKPSKGIFIRKQGSDVKKIVIK